MQYDYIIVGAGAAGLMLADAMGKDSYFADKSILLLDKEAKKTNDRTWSFWEREKGDFDSIIHKTWEHIHVATQSYSKRMAIAPYTYKTLRGIDFYEFLLSNISSYNNITFLQETVTDIKTKEDGITVNTETNTYSGAKGFSSIFSYTEALAQKKYPVLQQHFLGWFVKTKHPVFNVDTATFMDFSIPQHGNTRFMYVLPFSETEALVEYTLFSHTPLEKSEYETVLKNYMQHNLRCDDYEICEEETGSIPMTCFNFAHNKTTSFLPIGLAGGWAKPSSGYAFKNTQRLTKDLITHIKLGKRLDRFTSKNRFWYYDLILLDVLDKNNALGAPFFGDLFKKRKPQLVFKFLNEETSFLEDLGIVSAPKAWPFISALLGRIF